MAGRTGNQPRPRQKKTSPLEKTLAILIQSMRGNKIVVEMKNDAEISGILEETDRNMKATTVCLATYGLTCSRARPAPRQDRRILKTGISFLCVDQERLMIHHGLSMVDVRQTNPDGSVRKMDVVLVQGKMIRYVHIPDKVDAISNLQKHMRTMDQQGYRRNMLKPKPSQAPP
ncbi:unnamed protein product [Ectocarpus sp. 12 AP-2014]